MNDRFDVEGALRASAAAPTPVPDRAFVDGLERRLASGAMATASADPTSATRAAT